MTVNWLTYREMIDPTELENDWGEKLVVPWYAADDNDPEVEAQGKCLWMEQKLKHLADHVIYIVQWDACVYKNSHSWKLRAVVQKGDFILSSGPPTLVWRVHDSY